MNLWFCFVAAVLCWNLSASATRLSGLYVDNGLDQTVVQRLVTTREKRDVEDELLTLLGLPDRPPSLRKQAGEVQKSAPQFLIDIYENTIQHGGETRKDQFGLSNQDLRAIDESDIIMTFSAKKKKVNKIRHGRGKRLSFDVSEITQGEMILGAELRLYRDGNATKKIHSRNLFSVSVYRVLRTSNRERELQFVESVNITAKQGWISINVTEPIQHWINNPSENKGLYYTVHVHDDIQHEIKPRDIGLIGFKNEVNKQPFMVAYMKNSGIQEKRSRQKREAKRRRKSFSMYEYRNPYTDPAIRYNSRTCKLQNLYVSFKDLQWQDWIIAPDGYDAYFCSGECNFPLNAHMNATNHAIVQTLVHLLSPGKVPKPCCAPTKLTSISVLYFLDESNVILKKYKNMVVKSCGCH